MQGIRSRKYIIRTVQYAVLCLLSLFFLFPFVIMFTRSIMTDDEIMFAGQLFPSGFNFVPYAEALSPKMVVWLMNTLIIIAVNIVGVTLSATLCAYGFCKMKFPGRDICFAIMLSTLMLPSVAMQIPLYILYSNLGWIGTWAPMMIPSFFGGGAMTIFLMRQFMKGIPNSISEAAKMDGANSFQIYLRMVIPLSWPIITFTMVNTFLGTWNDFMTPLMYLQNYERKFTLSLGMYMEFKAGGLSMTVLPNVQMAAGVMMIIPCMILFFFFQKQLIQGVTMSAIKG